MSIDTDYFQAINSLKSKEFSLSKVSELIEQAEVCLTEAKKYNFSGNYFLCSLLDQVKHTAILITELNNK
jgi:hypothetical protein